jgi:hypothetical protein
VTTPLVDADALAQFASGVGVRAPVAPGDYDATDAYFADIAQEAEDLVRAWCTRGLPEPPPPVAGRVATRLAYRMLRNPLATRSVSVDGQAADLPTFGITPFETVLLGRWRLRAA